MDKSPKRFDVQYSLHVGDREVPHTLEIEAISRYEAKQKLLRKINKMEVDDVTIVEIKQKQGL